MSRPAVAAWGYLVATAAYLYGVVDPGRTHGAAAWTLFAAFGVLHAGTGFLGKSFRLLLLPLAAILVAVPAGLPDAEGEPFPLWVDLVLWSPFGALLILGGVMAAQHRSR